MAAKKTTTKKVTRKNTATKAKPRGTAKASGRRTAAKRPAKKKAERGMSQIEAAAKVLEQAGEPMTCRAMVEAMQKKGLWKSPGGKTPDHTLYASILRDLKKGKEARFKKAGRGLFALNDAR